MRVESFAGQTQTTDGTHLTRNDFTVTRTPNSPLPLFGSQTSTEQPAVHVDNDVTVPVSPTGSGAMETRTGSDLAVTYLSLQTENDVTALPSSRTSPDPRAVSLPTTSTTDSAPAQVPTAVQETYRTAAPRARLSTSRGTTVSSDPPSAQSQPMASTETLTTDSPPELRTAVPSAVEDSVAAETTVEGVEDSRYEIVRVCYTIRRLKRTTASAAPTVDATLTTHVDTTHVDTTLNDTEEYVDVTRATTHGYSRTVRSMYPGGWRF